jgi:hypothetical protein
MDSMRSDEFLDSHPKVRDALFVRTCVGYDSSDLGSHFLWTLPAVDETVFNSIDGGALKNSPDRDVYRETLLGMSKPVEWLRIQCDLNGVDYDECCECMREYIKMLYTEDM